MDWVLVITVFLDQHAPWDCSSGNDWGFSDGVGGGLGTDGGVGGLGNGGGAESGGEESDYGYGYGCISRQITQVPVQNNKWAACQPAAAAAAIRAAATAGAGAEATSRRSTAAAAAGTEPKRNNSENASEWWSFTGNFISLMALSIVCGRLICAT